MLQIIKNFFASVFNTSKGILVPEELVRSILASLGTGSVMSLGLTLLQSLLSNAAVIFPNPIVGGLVTVVLTLLIDLVRRLNQGPVTPVTPAPAPAPAPAPTPSPSPAPTPTTPTV